MFGAVVVRPLIAGLIVAGLAIGVWLLWPQQVPIEPSTTEPMALTASTSTTARASSTTTTTTSFQTTQAAGHVVETVEEAGAILRDLWFGWFEGIYNQDEDRIREVVASQQLLDNGVSAIGTLDFIAPPIKSGIEMEEIEILFSSEDCVSIWSKSNANSFLGSGPSRTGVDVLRWVSGWRLVSTWKQKGDLWQSDCESELEPLS